MNAEQINIKKIDHSALQRLRSIAQLSPLEDGQAVQISGTISQLQSKATKAGRPMAFLTLKDCDGTVEVLVFPDAYAKCTHRLQVDAAVVVTGAINLREDKPKIYATDVMDFAAVTTALPN